MTYGIVPILAADASRPVIAPRALSRQASAIDLCRNRLALRQALSQFCKRWPLRDFLDLCPTDNPGVTSRHGSTSFQPSAQGIGVDCDFELSLTCCKLQAYFRVFHIQHKDCIPVWVASVTSCVRCGLVEKVAAGETGERCGDAPRHSCIRRNPFSGTGQLDPADRSGFRP
jgi:hypothetical protein